MPVWCLVDEDLARRVVGVGDLGQLALELAQLLDGRAEADDGVVVVGLTPAGLEGLEEAVPQRPPACALALANMSSFLRSPAYRRERSTTAPAAFHPSP